MAMVSSFLERAAGQQKFDFLIDCGALTFQIVLDGTTEARIANMM
jgi:hypothetical protein